MFEHIEGSFVKDFNIHQYDLKNSIYSYDGFDYLSLLKSSKNENLALVCWIDSKQEDTHSLWFALSNKDNILSFISKKQSLLTTIEKEVEFILFEMIHGKVIPNTTKLISFDNFPNQYKPSKESLL